MRKQCVPGPFSSSSKGLGTRLIRRVPWCIANATDRFSPGEIRSIKHVQDSLVQACAVVLIGVSDIGVATMSNQKALFVTLVDHVPRFEAY
jgi:hypothetical protein